MKKIRILSLVIALLMLVTVFAACNQNNSDENKNQNNGEKTKVTLTVWGSQEDQEMLKEMCAPLGQHYLLAAKVIFGDRSTEINRENAIRA